MIKKTIPDLSFAQICDSGQCFRMERAGEGHYRVIASDRYLELWQEGEECVFSCKEEEFASFWRAYFDLDRDYGDYRGKISPDDQYLAAAAAFGSGIRILKQDLWETIVSFLISQQNNILRIRRCIQSLCENSGEKHLNFRGETFTAFPLPEVLAKLPEDGLRACNLGYRSRYVVRAAKSAVEGSLDLEELNGLPYPEAKAELLKICGVGEKVADCVCLFALHHLEAFPVDTHIRQAVERHYQRGFPKGMYQGFEGVLQQYIFYYELESAKA